MMEGLEEFTRRQYREVMQEDYGLVWYVPEEEGGIWRCENMVTGRNDPIDPPRITAPRNETEEEEGEERGRWRKRPTQADATEEFVDVTARRIGIKTGGSKLRWIVGPP